MDGFSYQDIESMSKLLNLDTNHTNLSNSNYYNNNAGSVLNPHKVDILANRNNNLEKEIAQPFAKIEQKFNKRILTKPENQIWDDNEFKEENIIEDGRIQPEFEILYKQDVGTEDVYFGMNGKDISSNSCDQLSIRIKLPDTNLKEINVEVKSQSIHLNVSIINNCYLLYSVS